LKCNISVPNIYYVDYDKVVWNAAYMNDFVNTVKSEEHIFKNINDKLVSGEYDINECMSIFSNTVQTISMKCFSKSLSNRPKPCIKKKALRFNSDCKKVKSGFFAAKRRFYENKTDENK
jgi:hypothetical protein